MDSNLSQIVDLCSVVDAELVAQQTIIDSIPQNFLSGNLGVMCLDLHFLPGGASEGLLRWYASYKVGGGVSLSGSALWDPATAESAALFASNPVGQANCYQWMVLQTPYKLLTQVTDSRIFAMTTAQQSNCQALEWEWQQTVDGQTHNGAYQFDFFGGHVRYFDFTAKTWKPISSIPLPDLTDGPVAVSGLFACSPKSTTHVSLTIDSKVYPVNIEQPSTPTTNANKFTTAIQLDARASGAPTGVYITQHDVLGVF